MYFRSTILTKRGVPKVFLIRMSKQRYVQDSFWTDPYIESLETKEKLLFLYYLTNPLCNIAGIYEIRNSRISYETGIDVKSIEKMKQKFQKDGKIIYLDDWILLINFAKNQSTNPNVLQGMQRLIDALPSHVKALEGFRRLSHFTLLNLTLPNLTETAVVATKSDIISSMYNYTLVDDDGNPIGGKKKHIKISKEENNLLITVGLLWQKMASDELDLRPEEVVMKNIYYPIREVYNREKWTKENYKDLFSYFFVDKKIPDESKLSFDLCLSQKYVAKFKLSQRSKNNSQTSLASEIRL